VRRVAILQPSYLPWLGYFEQLAHADVFVFLDDVQYTRSDWRNRNRIKTPRGPAWITVPVQRTGLQKTIADTYIDYTSDWPVRHLNLLRENYRRAPHFDEVMAIIERRLLARAVRLVDLCVDLILDFANYMALPAHTQLASALNVNSADPHDRLIALCRAVGATEFYEGRAGSDYLEPARFAEAGIDLVYQDYRHPEYAQSFPPFISHLSIVDLLFHHGRDAGAVVLAGHGTVTANTNDGHNT